MRFWNYAAGEPWAITESALNNILAIASRQNEPIKAISTRFEDKLDNSHVSTVSEGVAIIPVVGPLFRYANIFTAISGASSYEILSKDFTVALENPAVKAIVLDIDSPGGEINGCAEFANKIFEARGQKPIIAYASGDAASGAYWIASACDQVIVSETSMVGSIGVVGVYRGGSDKNSVEIVSSQSPYKRLDPHSDQGKERLQSRIDELATVFIEAIAKHRGLDPPTVIQGFGGGDVFVGKHAITQGMADDLGSLEKIIQTYSNKHSYSKQCTATLLSASVKTHQEPTMTDDTPKTEPIQQQDLSLEALKTDHPQLVEAIQAEATATATQNALAQGIQQERKRIGDILSADIAKGRESLAQHLAFATDMTVDMALATLQAAPAQSTVQTPASTTTGFEQVMASVTNPSIEPTLEDHEGDDVETIAKRIAQSTKGGTA